jgi:hypothetical protein
MNITLKPVSIPIPRTIDPELRRAINLAEEAIRENNALIEHALNTQTAAPVSTGDDVTIVLNQNILHIS